MDRQRVALRALLPDPGRRQLGIPVLLLASPIIVSGLSISHSTGSADCACPTSTIVGSMSREKNCTGLPFWSSGSDCQVSGTASSVSNPVTGIWNAVAPRLELGTLPQCQAF